MVNDARHIPEDELHAYLDQALSRSQCVEIECHLAECIPCQALRDEVAAARDRVTALLADTAPRRVTVPPFASLAGRHQDRVSARAAWRTRIRRAGMAAAAVMAAGAGWAAFRPGRVAAPVAQPIETAAAAPAVPAEPTTAIALTEAPQPEPLMSSRTLVALGPVRMNPGDPTATPAPAIRRVESSGSAGALVQSTVVSDDEAGLPLEGMWLSVDWDQAMQETGGNLPRIGGLPVLDVQIQRSNTGERPVVVVSQSHPSGRIIRTIEGPMERVINLLEGSAGRLKASAPMLSSPDYVGDASGNARRSIRIFAVMGQFGSDSLNLIAKAIDVRD